MDRQPLVFLVDVDNTLLDNDQFQTDLKAHIEREAGTACKDRYWAIQEHLFQTLGYRDYLGAFQQYRLENPDDQRATWLALFVMDYPFDQLLYPGALDVVSRLQEIGRTVALTDGDATFQPRKLQRSGLIQALGGELMICVHKEKEVARIEARYPAERYVVVDDKLRILTAFKRIWGDRVMTVFPRQGQFAFDPEVIANNPPADLTVEHIGDLRDPTILSQLRVGASTLLA